MTLFFIPHVELLAYHCSIMTYKCKILLLFSQQTGCQGKECGDCSIVGWMWMLILNSPLFFFFSLQGSERHSEEFAV